MRCEDAAKHLTKVVDGSDALPRDVAAHVEHCLRCQAESARYRRVARTMRQLRSQVAAPGPDLSSEILEWIHSAEEAGMVRASRLRRTVYVAAAATAATAGAAGAIVLASRSRRGRLPLAG